MNQFGAIFTVAFVVGYSLIWLFELLGVPESAGAIWVILVSTAVGVTLIYVFSQRETVFNQD